MAIGHDIVNVDVYVNEIIKFPWWVFEYNLEYNCSLDQVSLEKEIAIFQRDPR